MATRQNRLKVSTPTVQGDDSYVIVTLPSVQEVRDILAHEGQLLEVFDDGSRVIARHVHEWNWVDNDGQPMPAPVEKAKIVEELTSQEYRVLLELLLGSEAERKN